MHLKECFVRLERLNLEELCNIAEFYNEDNSQPVTKSVNSTVFKELFVTMSLSSSDFTEPANNDEINKSKQTKSVNSNDVKERFVTVSLNSSEFTELANTDEINKMEDTKSVNSMSIREQSVTVSHSALNFTNLTYTAEINEKHNKFQKEKTDSSPLNRYTLRARQIKEDKLPLSKLLSDKKNTLAVAKRSTNSRQASKIWHDLTTKTKNGEDGFVPQIGTVVLAKMRSYKPWPAIILNNNGRTVFWVRFFGKGSHGSVKKASNVSRISSKPYQKTRMMITDVPYVKQRLP